MSLTESFYAAEITEILDDHFGPYFEYPESFESDVHVCRMLKLPVMGAAEKLIRDYEEEEEQSDRQPRSAGAVLSRAMGLRLVIRLATIHRRGRPSTIPRLRLRLR